jgi:hypothetical protein
MKYLLLFAAVLSLSHTALAQDAMSVRTTQPMVIDGRAYEWPAFFRFYAPGTEFQFDILNDDTNLYLCVRATEIAVSGTAHALRADHLVGPCGQKETKERILISYEASIHAPGENPMDPPLMARNADPSSMPSLHSRANKIRERVILSQVSIKSIGLPGIPDGSAATDQLQWSQHRLCLGQSGHTLCRVPDTALPRIRTSCHCCRSCHIL